VSPGPAQPQAGFPEPPAAPPLSRDDEMERARYIVAGLLPSTPPRVAGFDIAVFSQSRHVVGGDYFDFVPLADGRLAIAIADVSGKGLAAAMIMVRLREIVHGVLAHLTTAGEAVAMMNARLADSMPRGTFITFLLALLDPRSRELRAVNAGHCAPMVWRARLTGVRLLPLRGPALGLLGPERFAQAVGERVVALESGDCLCVFTDGVLEARNPGGEEFGATRLAAALRRHAGRPAREIADGIVAEVEGHMLPAPQHDDMALIVLKAL